MEKGEALQPYGAFNDYKLLTEHTNIPWTLSLTVGKWQGVTTYYVV